MQGVSILLPSGHVGGILRSEGVKKLKYLYNISRAGTQGRLGASYFIWAVRWDFPHGFGTCGKSNHWFFKHEDKMAHLYFEFRLFTVAFGTVLIRFTIWALPHYISVACFIAHMV